AARPLPARRATAQTRAGGLDARRLPADAARDAGRAGRLRRTLSALRRGHRALLPRGESRLGALVRARGGGDAPLRRGDRPPSADAPHPLALARDCPLRAQTSGAVARAVTPNVRVVIPTYDAKALTLACLESVVAADWPEDSLEIVVVDNGSADG